MAPSWTLLTITGLPWRSQWQPCAPAARPLFTEHRRQRFPIPHSLKPWSNWCFARTRPTSATLKLLPVSDPRYLLSSFLTAENKSDNKPWSGKRATRAFPPLMPGDVHAPENAVLYFCLCLCGIRQRASPIPDRHSPPDGSPLLGRQSPPTEENPRASLSGIHSAGRKRHLPDSSS